MRELGRVPNWRSSAKNLALAISTQEPVLFVRVWRAAFRHDIILTYFNIEKPRNCRARSASSRLNVMPGDPKECRQRGLRCTELAEKATDPELKAVLESLAKRWLRLAAELDLAQALWDQGEPSPKITERPARPPLPQSWESRSPAPRPRRS